MNPLKPQEIYKRTSQRLNLPYEYVKDVVEYFYLHNKTRMHSLSFVIFNISGLGRFIIRPLKFWQRKKKLEYILQDFEARRDNRGLMIKRELEKRYEEMQSIDEEVKKLYEYKKKQMYGDQKDLEK